ncbi:circadian clock KaiB family protein [Chitinispirillales bacterium ANBcel5]|uniref:circadian clock KaiB family protein n=1 Tax=Cellulosispirillum alkaliphilum TaxID=3039283 RepID=UPI002A565B80|nr:circadian clock KaiB family protein [Chitinispirillales bacterium ANBcel5]
MAKKKKSTTEEFEEAIKKGDHHSKFVLRLFVTGITPRSLEAIDQVRKLCEEHLHGRYELEIIDLYKQPNAARSDQVFAAPMLIKKLPLPVRKIVGDMTKEEKLLAGLDIEIVE